MKASTFTRCLIGTLLLCLHSACQKMTDEELAENTSKVLNVKARSSSNAGISYPLYLYAFDKNGNCSASQVIENEEEAIRLELAGGAYRIAAVSGVSGGYTLPEKPNLESGISISSTSGASTPMMSGKADVNVSSKETSLNITLSYAVTAISVALKGVSSDVSAVKLTLSSFHSSLFFSGEYGGDAQSLEIPCTLDTENIWSAKTVYAFPGSGNETVFSIQLTKKDGTQATYAYTYQGAPEANRPFNISGNYAGSVTVGGEFIVKDWDSSINVEFDFGGATTDNGEDNGKEEEQQPSGTPQVGTIWGGGIVVDVETNTQSVLLMSTDEWECYSSGLAELLEEYATNDWLLPDATQARLLNATFQDESLTALNEMLEENGYTTINVEKRYLYDNGGETYAFGFKSTSKFLAAGAQTKYKVRLVKATKYNPS